MLVGMNDFDFQRYVAKQKQQVTMQMQEGWAYAFQEDVDALSKISKLSPIFKIIKNMYRPIIEEFLRKQTNDEAAEPQSFAIPIMQINQEVATSLRSDPLPLYLVKNPEYTQTIAILGMEKEEVYILVHVDFIKTCDEGKLRAALGRVYGHFQNGHVPYLTALRALNQIQGALQWVGLPVNMLLRMWVGKAQYTADRAMLVAKSNLDDANWVIEHTADPPILNLIEKRKKALQVFSKSRYIFSLFGQEGGLSKEECDEKVSNIVKESDENR